MNLQPFSVLPIINDVIVNITNFSTVPDHKFMYVCICLHLYLTPITLGLLSMQTANQITDSKCVSSEYINGGGHFLYRYKILPQILSTVLLQRTNLVFVGLLLSKKLQT